MNIQEFAVQVSNKAGPSEVETMQLLSVIDELLEEKTGISIYSIIRKMRSPRKSNKG